MHPLFFALLSFFSWGIGDIFGVIAARRINSLSVTYWSYIMRLCIFGLYIPFGFSELSRLTAPILALNLFLGIFFLAGIILFYQALRMSNASIVATIAGSYLAVSVIFSVLFLGETLSTSQILSIAIIFIGVILSSLDFSVFKKAHITDRGILLSFVPMLCWGIYYSFIKIPVRQIGWFWPNYISFMLLPLVYGVSKISKIPIQSPFKTRSFIYILIAIVLFGTAEFSYNFAISIGQTSIVAPIAGSFPTLFVVLAFLIFKDPITKQQIVGIITTLVGIVLLSFLSV